MAESKGDFARAELHYKNALVIAESDSFGRPAELITRGYLAHLYDQWGKDSDADLQNKERIRLAEKLSTEEPELALTTYDQLALHYLLKKRYEQAKPIYERSLALTTATGNEDKLAEKLQLYAMLLRLNGKNDEAKDLEARLAALKHAS